MYTGLKPQENVDDSWWQNLNFWVEYPCKSADN